jgi:hypothetical protein
MNKSKQIRKIVKQHLPTILILSGLGLTVGAKLRGEKEAVRYDGKIKAEEAKRKEEDKEPLSKVDRAKIYFEYCWLSWLMETGGIGLVLYGHKMTLSQITTLLSLYHFAKKEGYDLKEMIKNETSNTTLQNLQKKILNDDKDNEVMFENLKQRCTETGYGNTMFIDEYSGAVFHSSISAVGAVFNQVNETLIKEAEVNDGVGFVELSDVFSDLRIPRDKRKCGKAVSFRYDRDGGRGLIDLHRILDWKDYMDPITGEPRVCVLKYYSYLVPSDDFANNRPQYYY